MEGTIAEQEGLRAVGFQNITTTVEIKGMKYEIGGYTEKDLVATVNLDNVTKEGTYSLNIEAESVHTSDQCEILSCYPETIDVTFEHFGEQSFNVEAEAPNVTAEDDSFVAKTSVSPAKVVVTGSDENLKKIKRVAAITKEEKIISDDITISTSDLVFYDENDNIISSTNFTVDNQNFDIAFSVQEISSASELLFHILKAMPQCNGNASALPLDAHRTEKRRESRQNGSAKTHGLAAKSSHSD